MPSGDGKTSGGFVCYTRWGFALSLTYGMGLMLNIFHLVVLLKLPSLRRTSNQAVLVHITLSDIAIAVTRMVYYVCFPYFFHLSHESTPANHVIGQSILESTNLIGYFVFLFGSVEKFYAFCQPLRYRSSTVVGNLHVCLSLSWIFVLAVTIIEVYIGATLMPSAFLTNMWKLGVIIALPFIPSALSAAMLVKVYREVNSIKVHDTRTARSTQSKVAAKYFMVIFVLFVAVWILQIICVSVRFITANPAYMKIFHLTKSAYTVVNTILYGWMSRPYRQYVSEKLGICECKKRSDSDQPPVSQTNTTGVWL